MGAHVPRLATDPCKIGGCVRFAPFPRMKKKCSVEECTEHSRSKGYCNRHYQKWRTYGNPRASKPREYQSGPLAPNWRGDDISYYGAHYRVVTQRGKASELPCSDCGLPATEWSYDGLDPTEKVGEVQWGAGAKGVNSGVSLMRYSINPVHYVPRCRECHRAFDSDSSRALVTT